MKGPAAPSVRGRAATTACRGRPDRRTSASAIPGEADRDRSPRLASRQSADAAAGLQRSGHLANVVEPHRAWSDRRGLARDAGLLCRRGRHSAGVLHRGSARLRPATRHRAPATPGACDRDRPWGRMVGSTGAGDRPGRAAVTVDRRPLVALRRPRDRRRRDRRSPRRRRRGSSRPHGQGRSCPALEPCRESGSGPSRPPGDDPKPRHDLGAGRPVRGSVSGVIPRLARCPPEPDRRDARRRWTAVVVRQRRCIEGPSAVRGAPPRPASCPRSLSSRPKSHRCTRWLDWLTRERLAACPFTGGMTGWC